jgi:GR25 family glycosyltransferase involved in LPS biosynthesis
MDTKRRVIYREPHGRPEARRYLNNCDGWSDTHRGAKRFLTYAEARNVLDDLDQFVDNVRIGRVAK